MANTDAESIFIIVLFFLIIGFVAPFFAMQFGSTVATYDIEGVGTASAVGVLNAVTSVLFWTFGIPAWINLTLFLALRVMMWVMILRNTPFIGTGGS